MVMTEKADFYYSERVYQMRKSMKSTWIDDQFEVRDLYFKGQLYTEMIEHGHEPMTKHFGDLVFLGTGRYDDIISKLQ